MRRLKRVSTILSIRLIMPSTRSVRASKRLFVMSWTSILQATISSVAIVNGSFLTLPASGINAWRLLLYHESWWFGSDGWWVLNVRWWWIVNKQVLRLTLTSPFWKVRKPYTLYNIATTRDFVTLFYKRSKGKQLLTKGLTLIFKSIHNYYLDALNILFKASALIIQRLWTYYSKRPN